jgi:hypothetical protein
MLGGPTMRGKCSLRERVLVHFSLQHDVFDIELIPTRIFILAGVVKSPIYCIAEYGQTFSISEIDLNSWPNPTLCISKFLLNHLLIKDESAQERR